MVKREGARDEGKFVEVPLCFGDYVDYYQSKDCPGYERALAIRRTYHMCPSESGLSQSGAEAKWKRDFADPSVDRFQAKKIDDEGKWSGELVPRPLCNMHWSEAKVWALYVRKPKKKVHTNFKDNSEFFWFCLTRKQAWSTSRKPRPRIRASSRSSPLRTSSPPQLPHCRRKKVTRLNHSSVKDVLHFR